jgi:acetylornithine deacetylase/succinyl-diaminopimelate desuccinylase-like protein
MVRKKNMDTHLDALPIYVEKIQSVMETIITNIILLGQIPSPTFQEKRRTALFLDRLAEFQVDEATTDGYRNPIGIIRGTSRTKPPIFVVAHMDTSFGKDVDHNITVGKSTITGAGVLDNSVGVGVLVSLPELLRLVDLRFESDIVLAGVIQSIGKGNLRGIRHLLKTWSTPIRGAICIEGGELGRLNYYANGMIRGEIDCKITKKRGRSARKNANAILVINEVIDQILALRLPQRPHSEIVIGTISGGLKHGRKASEANFGFEIRSDSDEMVQELYTEIRNIVDEKSHEYDLDMTLKTISNVSTSRLRFNHPLVRQASQVMDRLGLSPVSEPSESELSIFLSRNIPAVTLGITYGESYQDKKSVAEIEPMFKGIAQIIGVLKAIDSGACDEG